MVDLPQEGLTMKIGITGHQHLQDPTDWAWVKSAMEEIIEGTRDLVGVTSLAVGADSVFAELVLKAGGKLLVIVPFAEYALEFQNQEDKVKYEHFLRSAEQVETLNSSTTKEKAYYSAGKYLVDTSERIIAVWDGKPAAGLGGTGDIVEYAVEVSTPVYHLNPETHTVNYIYNQGSEPAA